MANVSITDDSQWRWIERALTCEKRIYMPSALRTSVTSLFHNVSKSSPFGAMNMADSKTQHINWLLLHWEIGTYVAGCVLCHQIKAPHHTQYGLDMPLSLPSDPWEGLTMDIVTDLPGPMASGYAVTWVFVDCLTNITTQLPCRKDIDSSEQSLRFFELMICECGVDDNITNNCSKGSTSQYWDRVCFYLSINHRFSPAFNLQMDGHTELRNQMM